MNNLRRLRSVAALAAGTALLLVPAVSAATTATYTPFTMDVLNPCNGDNVVITGTMHAVDIINANKAEETVNWPDTSGVGIGPNGVTPYQANDTTHTYVQTVHPGQATVSLRDNFELISQDPSANFIVHVTMQLTIDLNGNVIDTKMTPNGTKCAG